MFFKSKSDKLLLYYLYNYKIELKDNNTLKYSLLYKITIAELKTVKEYCHAIQRAAVRSSPCARGTSLDKLARAFYT
jgi:GT2 family glycosyltransferase